MQTMKKILGLTVLMVMLFSLLVPSTGVFADDKVTLDFANTDDSIKVENDSFTVAATAGKAYFLNGVSLEKEKTYEISFTFNTPLEPTTEYSTAGRWFQHAYIAIRHGAGTDAAVADSKDGQYIRLELNGNNNDNVVRAWVGDELLAPNPGWYRFGDFELKANQDYNFKIITTPTSLEIYVDGKRLLTNFNLPEKTFTLPSVEDATIGFGFAGPNGKLPAADQTYTISNLEISEGVLNPYVSAGEFTHIYDPSVGEDEDWYINDHSIIKGDDGKWHLFGITHEEPSDPLDEKNFAHATGDELTEGMWEKQPFALTADQETYGEYHLWAPHVIKHEDLYYMYYCAGGPSGDKYQINLATSTDLVNWERHEANPLVIDGFDARDPMIIKDGDQWIMYYTANSAPTGGNHIVAAVTSTDLVNWDNRTVVYTDEATGTSGGPTESPFVVYEGGKYFLFIGPYPGYAGTRVFMSDDPLDFENAPFVGFIPAHAAEVVRDDDGKYYITHCGWGQGGVYIAPLSFENIPDPTPEPEVTTTTASEATTTVVDTTAAETTGSATTAKPLPGTGDSGQVVLAFAALLAIAAVLFISLRTKSKEAE